MVYSFQEYKELVASAKTSKFYDPWFPTLEEFDRDMAGFNKQYDENEKDFITFLIWMLGKGIETDEAWKKQNDYFDEEYLDLLYFIKPYEQEDSELHTGVWGTGESRQSMEDKEAAFEVMQDHLRDSINIIPEEGDDDIAYAAALLTTMCDKVKSISMIGSTCMAKITKSAAAKLGTDSVVLKSDTWKGIYDMFPEEEPVEELPDSEEDFSEDEKNDR